MSVLDRYVIRNFFLAFAIALTVMVVMVVSLHLMFQVGEFTEAGPAGKDPGLATILTNIAEYYRYQIFIYFSHMLGFVALVAGAFTIGRMTKANELTALLASGVPLGRVLLPVALCAAICAGLWLANAELVIPQYADKLTRDEDDIGGSGRRFNIVMFREVIDPTTGKDQLFNAERFFPLATPPKLFGVTVLGRENGRVLWNLRADRAWWDHDQQVWKLQRGVRSTPPPPEAGLEFAEVIDESKFTREEMDALRTSLTPQELAYRQQTRWVRFLSWPELMQMASRPGLPARQQHAVTLQSHLRLTEPLIGMLTVVLGSAIFLRRGPANLVLQSTQCIAVCGGIFVAQFAFQSLHNAPPALIAWLPVFLTAAATGFVYGNLRS